jgi:hypothetical protein
MVCISLKVARGYLTYPLADRDTAKSVRHEAQRWNEWKTP